jgi:DNA-binding Lrp family transcriptional regulator
LPKRPCAARVSRLVDAGLIRITAVGDPLRLGIEVASITLISVRPGSAARTAERLAAYPNVRFVGESFGSADIIIQTLHPDLRSLHRFVGTELPEALPEITRTETFSARARREEHLELAGLVRAGADAGGAERARGRLGRSRFRARALVGEAGLRPLLRLDVFAFGYRVGRVKGHTLS